MIPEQRENIDRLIARVFAGEAGKDDHAQLALWRNEDPANEQYYLENKKVLDALSPAAFEPDVHAAWDKLNARIQPKQARVIPLKRRALLFRAAAAVVLLAGMAFVIGYFISGKDRQQVILATTDAVKSQALPDGSTVRVAANSEIRYQKLKNGGRQVLLKGEAFFEVTHNEAEPFIVKVEEVLVRDIGTAFHVKTLPGEKEVEVLVESGEVQFYTERYAGIRLVQGEKAVYNRLSHEFRKLSDNSSAQAEAHLSRVFRFQGTRLSEVIEQISVVYGAKIRLADKRSGDCRLSVSFNNEPLDVVLAVIAETLDLQTTQRGDTIMLQGNGCHQ